MPAKTRSDFSQSGIIDDASIANVGIHLDELLLPEMLKQQGYATAILGTWHLGTVAEFLPISNGFDEFLGIPYSNDNTKYHPVLHASMPPLPLYVPHVMPHVPIFASDRFKGKSARGLYGDAIEELDWSVGEILDALTRLHLNERTLVIFMSENGPFLSYGDHAGSAGGLREGKLTSFEGGVRTLCLMRWTGKFLRPRNATNLAMTYSSVRCPPGKLPSSVNNLA